MMCSRERPRSFGPSPIGLHTFVATITSGRLPRALIQLPKTVSDWPRLYESEVSTKLPPCSKKASSTASDCAWSVIRPNVFVPRQNAETFNPVRPRLRYCTRPSVTMCVMKAEIISCGTELLLGHIVDTNAAWLAQQLAPLGIDVYYVSQVGDNRGRVVGLLQIY